MLSNPMKPPATVKLSKVPVMVMVAPLATELIEDKSIEEAEVQSPPFTLMVVVPRPPEPPPPEIVYVQAIL